MSKVWSLHFQGRMAPFIVIYIPGLLQHFVGNFKKRNGFEQPKFYLSVWLILSATAFSYGLYFSVVLVAKSV